MTHQARIFISTGEVSGDLQGSLLVQALQQQATTRQLDLEILALGGTRMAQAGAKIIGETTGIGSVGIFEALPYILPTLQVQRMAKRALTAQPPALAILIDYMNPNLAMGQFLRQRFPESPVVYYIAPQQWVWAFSTKDSRQIVQNADKNAGDFSARGQVFSGIWRRCDLGWSPSGGSLC
jgi:lipid-A-disaccharide synthase